MQFPDILKKYRANKNISQKELAEQLKISAISVSRIEQGVNIRPEVDVIKQLGSMMEDKGLDNIEGIFEIRRWFESAKSFDSSKRLPVEIRKEFVDDIIKDDVIKKIISDFSYLGFERIGGEDVKIRYAEGGRAYKIYSWGDQHEVTGFDAILKNERTGKIWAIDFLWEFPAPFEYLHEELCLKILYNSIGRSGYNGTKIHKYSLITNLLAVTEYLQNNPFAHPNLNYDVSFIHYDLMKYRMDREVNLTFFKDGQGLFDLNVEGKEEKATLDYAKWNLLLSE